MMRVAIRLDSLLHDQNPPTAAKAARVAAVASLAGADSLLAVLPAADPAPWNRPLQFVKDTFDGPLIVAAPVRDDALAVVNELRPDLTVFTRAGLLPIPEDDLGGQPLRDATESLRTSRLPFAVHVESNVQQIKLVRQLNADAVLLPAGPVLDRDDQEHAVREYHTLEAAVIAADKLGLRVLLEGDLDRASWEGFRDLGLIEGAVVGASVVERAILLGLGPALSELNA